MKKSNVLIFVAISIALAGCSGSSGGGGGGAQKHGSVASEKISGRLVPDIHSIQHQPAAQQQLETWQNECRTVDGYKIPGLSAGMRVETREDEISLWPDLKPTGDARTLEQTVERVVSDKEFFSIQNQISENYSITSRYHHTAGSGYYGSTMVDIISTDPPELKNQIGNGSGQTDDTYVRCRSNGSNWKRDVAFATLTLQNGRSVRGILVVESHEIADYTCGLYRADDSLIREDMLAAKGSDESVSFYAKDLVSPFTGHCHADASLLSVRTVRDVSGKNGILNLDKREVLSF